MASTPVVASLLDTWTVWNIRGFMILSLSMQLLLAIVSPLRKKTSNRWVILMIWSAYFLSDWAAIFAFGLISNARLKNPTSPLQVDQDLLAFWSAFLLIHLGGLDSITAYALEDNTLWMRHLVGLVVQVLAFLNIFVKTLPSNDLRVPTILIAIAGAIKYGERTRALYLASVENLKESTVKSRGFGQDRNTMRTEGVAPQSNTGGSNSDEETHKMRIKTAFRYFEIFKGLVVDMMQDHSQWIESRNYYMLLDARATFDILKLELRFFYEVFYTKVLAANSAWGVLIRSLAFYNVLIALIMFCLIKKEGIHGVDVRITYSLLAGVIALDSASEILLARSNWSSVDTTYFGWQVVGHGLVLFFIVGTAIICIVSCYAGLWCGTIALREWSESTGALSILGRAFEESRLRKGSKLCDYWRKSNDCNMNGRTSHMNLAELRRYVDNLEFENSILIWHCATEICYQDDRHIDGDSNKRRKFSKVLSDYMVYLLIKQPKLMSPVAGIEKIRYRDTCVEAKNIGKRHPMETMDQFCKNILDEHMGTAESDDRTRKGKSVLSDACTVANTLRQKGSTKWDVISEVWVEVLLYAAGHCRADSHARLLSEGGELITFVWLLMAHFGIMARFPKE